MESYVYTRPYGTLNCLGCKLALRPTVDLASAPTNFWSSDFLPEAQGEQPAPKGAHGCSQPFQSPSLVSPLLVKESDRIRKQERNTKSQASLVPVSTEKPRHWKQLKAIVESNLNSKYMGFQRKKKCNEMTLSWKIYEVASSNYRSVWICFFHWPLI